MGLIALKVDVDTLRGTREGVPRLLRRLDRAGVRATFLFSMGPDHTGRSLRRALRPGFLSKVARTSVVAHYGWRTLLYGTLLPGPDIGVLGAEAMRAAAADGHECGLHAWDHVAWQDKVRHRDEAWTVAQMGLAHDRFVEVFGRTPATHGAAGWQMNSAAFRQLDRWGMTHASDGRGSGPYVPVVEGRSLSHVQLPTTLPTSDEMIGRDGVDAGNLTSRLLKLTKRDANQVFTLHAELEGGAFDDAFAALLNGWRAQGHRLGTLADARAAVDPARLPRATPGWDAVPGRSGEVIATVSLLAAFDRAAGKGS